ncbi:MAG TPA: aminoglycoside phosphotransferase family protein, partial [Gaiellales bacterium]
MTIEECAREWGLELGEPYPPGAAGYAVRADLPDGTRAVLKVIHPHRESEHEADALARWDGDGAVRLLDRDDARKAILMERCEPGTPLSAVAPDAGLDVLIGLLPRLWKPAGAPFHTLADEAAWWAGYLPREWEANGRPFERRLLDAAVDALEDLAPTQGEQVLL